MSEVQMRCERREDEDVMFMPVPSCLLIQRAFRFYFR
jgi:hypothetical protein